MTLRQISTLLLLAVAVGASASDVVWFDGQHPVTYQVVGKTDPVVKIALQMFESDMLQVTGMTPVNSEKIKVKSGNAAIRIVQGRGSDDGFRLRVKNGQILVEGHNGRGTAYGLLELSRMAGVSPWVWWGDVVPDDVTLMWCDDNYGYLTRLPDEGQQKRSGGGGVYYHLSYWGRPHDYLWLTTTQPGLIYSEMKAAYDHNCRKLWIANVHDPKVAAYDLELFLDLAWDIHPSASELSSFHPSPVTLHQHLENWLCTQFGEQAGKLLFPAMKEFYRLCGIRKPEFMGWTQVELDKKIYPGGKSRVGTIGMTRHEAKERLEAFEHLTAIVDKFRSMVRPELYDAYEAHIAYPICAAEAMTQKIVGDSAESHQAYERIQTLTKQYNALNHGKWNGLMDAAPRQLPVFDDVRGQLSDDTPFDGIARNACDFIPSPVTLHPSPFTRHQK